MPNELSALHMLLPARLAELGALTPEEVGVLLGIDADVADQLCRDPEEAGMIERPAI